MKEATVVQHRARKGERAGGKTMVLIGCAKQVEAWESGAEMPKPWKTFASACTSSAASASPAT